MKTYIVSGTDRQVGAIGIFEPFQVTVKAEDAVKAKEKARSIRYANNREHVHIADAAEQERTGINRMTTTQKAAHTPGPWELAEESWNDYVGHRIEGNGRLVAETRCEDSVEVSDEEAANATLIASAPELLAALERTLARLIATTDYLNETGEQPDCAVDNKTEIYQAQAAISKARGGSRD